LWISKRRVGRGELSASQTSSATGRAKIVSASNPTLPVAPRDLNIGAASGVPQITARCELLDAKIWLGCDQTDGLWKLPVPATVTT
jgi:hypothetical protein